VTLPQFSAKEKTSSIPISPARFIGDAGDYQKMRKIFLVGVALSGLGTDSIGIGTGEALEKLSVLGATAHGTDLYCVQYANIWPIRI
jgi:hypothetical protein